MPVSYAKKIEDELEYVSEFKEAVTKVSSHLSELDKKRLETYYVVIKNMRSYEIFSDMISTDTDGSVNAFREAVVLEIRYINSIYPHFDKFKSSFQKLIDSVPDKFDNDILAEVDNIFDDMRDLCRTYMSDLVKDLDNQLESTHMTKYGALLSKIPYYGKNQKKLMTEKFKEFIKSIQSENDHRAKFRGDIQEKRRMLEDLMPKITTVLKKKDSDNSSGRKDSYESSGSKYISNTSSSFSSFSSSSGSSSISMPSFTGGGGSFGGGKVVITQTTLYQTILLTSLTSLDRSSLLLLIHLQTR